MTGNIHHLLLCWQNASSPLISNVSSSYIARLIIKECLNDEDDAEKSLYSTDTFSLSHSIL